MSITIALRCISAGSMRRPRAWRAYRNAARGSGTTLTFGKPADSISRAYCSRRPSPQPAGQPTTVRVTCAMRPGSSRSSSFITPCANSRTSPIAAGSTRYRDLKRTLASCVPASTLASSPTTICPSLVPTADSRLARPCRGSMRGSTVDSPSSSATALSPSPRSKPRIFMRPRSSPS